LPRALDVLVVCDDLRVGLALREQVRRAPHERVRVLTANARGYPRLIFYAVLLRACVARPFAVAGLLTAGLLSWSSRRLEDPKLVGRVSADVGLHAAGAIYRRAFLDRFAIGLLNAHIGLLPRYRGRSVMEWTLLHGDETGITVFLVDEGIDTGTIVHRRSVPIPDRCTDVASAKSYLFSLDGELYREALEKLSEPGFEASPQQPADGVRYYRMSSLLTTHVSRMLARRGGPGIEAS
jgi:methionyl-tRNA formyltransferase